MLVRHPALLACALAAAVMYSGCGGAPEGGVPDVVGKRLDVAESDLKDAGYDTEEVGGGTFGIVVKSNWTVCETEPSAGATGASKVKLIVDRTCDVPAPAAQKDAAASDTPADGAEAGTTSTLEADPVRSSPTVATKKITVPDVVGMNHQAAQNRMQDAGLFALREEDATGRGRALLWDRNWVVVSQSPAAGTRVSEDRTITLRSKKYSD